MSETHDPITDTIIDAIIIGGGLSGLVAAHRLVEAGREVLVLEAGERVGGRTCRVEVGEAVLDGGGQWIGPSQRHVRALVAELGLSTFPTFHRGVKILDLGGLMKRYRGDIPSLPPHALVDLHLTMRRIARHARRVSFAAPLRDRRARRWDAQSLGEWMRRHVRTRPVRALITAAVRVILGAEPAEVSALFFLAYVHAAGGLEALISVEGGGQQWRIAGGAASIALELAGRLGARVRLGAAVTAVVQHDAHVEVAVGAERLRARRVIVALPPAHWGSLAMTPALDGGRAQLARRSFMGSALKVHAGYARPFWRAAGLSGEVVGDGLLCTVWDDTSHDGHAALLGFAMGRRARELEALEPAVRRQRLVEALARYFGDEARSPVAWHEQPWAPRASSGGGPVMLLPPGVLSEIGGLDARPHGRLHFAGTELATAWAGFMDGAVASGERAAAEVATAFA